MKTEQYVIKTEDGEDRDITLTVLPATAKTLKFITPVLQKNADSGANIKALLDALEASLKYTYSDYEIDEILDLIPIGGEDAKQLQDIAAVIFRGIQG